MAVLAKLRIGDQAPDFTLPGVDGKQYSLESFASKPNLVVVFSCNHCPYVQAYEDRMMALQRGYADRGVQLVLINPNDASRFPDDSYENMIARARKKSYPFPYLRDEDQTVARAYGAERTPHVFMFDKGRKLKYMGAIDDNWENPSQVKTHHLRNAIEAILNGQPIPRTQTMPVGCSVKWKAE